MKKQSLLQEIQEVTGFSYLSDLHQAFFNKRIENYIAEIPMDKYSLEEWQDAVNYILDIEENYADIDQARKRLFSKY